VRYPGLDLINKRLSTPQGGWRPIADANRKTGTPILIVVPPKTLGPCVYVAWNKDEKWMVFDSGHGHRAHVEAIFRMPIPTLLPEGLHPLGNDRRE
jgi:hypothetical protein